MMRDIKTIDNHNRYGKIIPSRSKKNMAMAQSIQNFNGRTGG
jgi:hypothetical protein